MANKPYDRRIINSLERPTSSDLNIAQAQINAGIFNLLGSIVFDATWPAQSSALASGFLNAGFKASVANPTERTIVLNPGIGISSTSFDDSASNIAGIAGLNRPYGFNPIFKDFSGDLITVTVPTPPAAGLCRRDAIYARAILASDGVADFETTDVYNTSASVFDTVSRNKTYTIDVANVPVGYIAQGAAASTPLVYVTGNTNPYTNPDSFFSITPPAPSNSGIYNQVAIINVRPNATSILTSDLIDSRRLIAPANQINLMGSATVGYDDATGPGGALSSVTLKAPAGCQATIYKYGNSLSPGDQANIYDLCIFGARNVDFLSANFSVYGLPSLPAAVQTRIVSQITNVGVTAAFQEYFADPAKSSPPVSVAVGQPYHLIRFAVGRVETLSYTANATVTNTLSGEVSIPNPPSYPNQWPTGTYNVAGNTDTRTYYLTWFEPPQNPLTGIPNPRYELSRNVSGATHSITYTSANITSTYQRIAGFVVNSSEQDQVIAPSGGAVIWKLYVRARYNPLSYSSPSRALLRARFFLYDGATNPELGVVLGQAESIVEKADGGIDVPTSQFEIYMPYNPGVGRLYLELSIRDTEVGGDAFNSAIIFFNGETTSILETNFLTETPTITIPQAGTAYPGGTYSVAQSGGVAVQYSDTRPGTGFNSATDTFSSYLSTPKTVPLTFNVNMHLDNE